MQNSTQQYIRIRPGYNHPVLGDIGGWEAVVLRSFTVQGVGYYDVEFTATTLAAIPNERSERLLRKEIIFTRIRIDQHLTSPASLNENALTRRNAINKIQRRWYDIVGSSEKDPTKLASDGQATVNTPSRRAFMTTMLAASVAMVAIVASQCEDCACGTGGTYRGGGSSWRRVGGGSSS